MIVAAIPVKSLAEAKSRLAQQLSSDERRDLVVSLLHKTITAIQASGVVERIAVVTPQASLAAELPVDVLPDAGSLNASLSGAVQWALSLGAGKLLIVPVDLPGITADAVRELIETDAPLYGIAIVSTVDGGTGALLLTPPNIIPPAFGPDSFARHLMLARLEGVRAEEVDSPAFALDLDTPDDLQRFTIASKESEE
jgi:2-phospho-L-lactate guanylyltransferase